MRKLTLLGALVALGWAGQAMGQSTREETREAGQAAERDARQAGERTRQWSGEQKDKAEGKMGSDRTGDSYTGQSGYSGEPANSGQSRTAQASGNEKKHPLFDGKSNYDVEGKVSKATPTSITVTREELPPATLTIDRNTKVEIDGQQASARMLKPGQDVKASFNLQGSKAMAVEVKAEKTDVQKQQQDQRKEMQEQRQEQGTPSQQNR